MSWKDFLNNKEEEQPQKEGRGMDQKSVAKPPVLFSETQQVLKGRQIGRASCRERV